MKNGAIKLMVVTDYALLREGLEKILGEEKDIVVIGNTSNVNDAIANLLLNEPDIMLLDITLLDNGGSKLLNAISDKRLPTRVLLFTDRADEETFMWSFSKGVQGCISRWTQAADVIKAIRKVHTGEFWLGRKVLSQLITSNDSGYSDRNFRLSDREEEITLLVANGCSNKEIADKLYISEKTVKCHITNIFRKMGIDSRLKLAFHVLSYDNRLRL